MRIQKVENVNKCLEFIRQRGVNLTNIGAEGRPLIIFLSQNQGIVDLCNSD